MLIIRPARHRTVILGPCSVGPRAAGGVIRRHLCASRHASPRRSGRCVTAEITGRHREIGAQPLPTNLLPTPTAIVHAGPIRKSATMNTLSADHAPSNSNDPLTTPVVDDLPNPLWIIAIGMACFFGTAVVVMALSWN
jgi:hypothetical protein